MEASLKARALRYLARREHSRAELERKLRAAAVREARRGRGPRDAAASDACEDRAADATPREGAATATLDETLHESQLDARIRETLDDLAARGLLSDARAAESLLATQGARLGQRRLKQALLARGLAPDLVRDTLQQSGATEFERARDLWRRRFGEVPDDAKAAARQMRFLAARGFDAEVIRRVMRRAPDFRSEE